MTKKNCTDDDDTNNDSDSLMLNEIKISVMLQIFSSWINLIYYALPPDQTIIYREEKNIQNVFGTKCTCKLLILGMNQWPNFKK